MKKLQYISTKILNRRGWKIYGDFAPELKKCIMVIAPHTSNWDFVIGRLAFWHLDMDIKWLIKKEAFFFPFGPFLKRMGGIPVNRSNPANIVDDVVDILNKNDSLVVTVTPEGTRKLVKNWKKGFYRIAQKANVPIVLGYLDYKTKEGGLGPIIYPSGDYQKDFEIITEFYKTKTARHPENFNLSPQNRKD